MNENTKEHQQVHGGNRVKGREVGKGYKETRRECEVSCIGSVEIKERFMKNVHKPEEMDCWIWTGTRGQQHGYGSLTMNYTAIRAHRMSWIIHNSAAILPGYIVCHTCDIPQCVNPAHLWIGTTRENRIDSWLKGRSRMPMGEAKLNVHDYAERTHCKNGHPISSMVRWPCGRSRCLLCNREQGRKSYRKRKADSTPSYPQTHLMSTKKEDQQ